MPRKKPARQAEDHRADDERKEQIDLLLAAAAQGIPRGYSLEKWDPSQRPLTVAGTVFDANSFGKWIFDWSVSRWGSGRAPIAEMCGQLWLQLIQFTGKLERLELAGSNHRCHDEQEMLHDFLKAGDLVWSKLLRIVDACGESMWSAVRINRDGMVAMGKESANRFLDTMFGRNLELPSTERWMASAQLWLDRFETNCAKILDGR